MEMPELFCDKAVHSAISLRSMGQKNTFFVKNTFDTFAIELTTFLSTKPKYRYL